MTPDKASPALPENDLGSLRAIRRGSVAVALVGAALFLFFLAARLCNAAEGPFDFGLSGTVTITKAELYFDGGSITISLRDEHGVIAHCGYRNDLLHGPDDHGGQLYFQSSGKGRNYFRRNGQDERALFKLLREASIATYGTSDPARLKQHTTPVDWNRLAVGRILSEASRRGTGKPAEK